MDFSLMIKFNEIDLGYVWIIERVLSKVTEWKRLDSNNHDWGGLIETNSMANS